MTDSSRLLEEIHKPNDTQRHRTKEVADTGFRCASNEGYLDVTVGQ